VARSDPTRSSSEPEFARSLEWLHAWSLGVAEVNVYTAPVRDEFMRTLSDVRSLPERGR
jgi:hypothetical protein